MTDVSAFPIVMTANTEERSVSRARREYNQRRDDEFARDLEMNWSSPVRTEVADYRSVPDELPKPISLNVELKSATMTNPPELEDFELIPGTGGGSKTDSETTASNSRSGARLASPSEVEAFREKCVILEKERADKDKLIEALLEQLEGEREAHANLKRGVESLGKELASVNKLVYTMDDELKAVYDLLARSRVVRSD